MTPAEFDRVVADIIAQLRGLPRTDVATVRRLRREISTALAPVNGQDVLQLALQLVPLAGFVFRFVAYEILLHHRDGRKLVDGPTATRLGKGLDSWFAVDAFACYVAGPAWRAGQIPDGVIRRWAKAADHWWRRAALVSTVPLNNKTQGGTGDAKRTLAICRALVGDRHDMVVKGMSWALRELAKRDPAAVEGFLREQAGALAARVVREVRNKLTTGRKNPKRE
jgi:3-methyladenine DNA glycosylase AlkD